MALTDEDRNWIETRLDQSFEVFSRHLLDQMSRRFAEVNATLASIDNRLKLQAGLIRSGVNGH